MNRRRFLQQLLITPYTLGAVSGTKLLFSSSSQAVAAEAFNGKTLLVIFQRGGCDGLNTLVPHAEAEYYRLRPGIAIPAPNSGQTGAAIDLDGFFGLHPSLAPLHSIFSSGDLAILPNVHYSNASSSHFDSQQLIESGVPEFMLDGWLNRHLSSQIQEGLIRATSLGSETAHALRGAAEVLSFNDFSEFSLGDNQHYDKLNAIYQQNVSVTDSNRWLIHQQGKIMLNNLDTLAVLSGQNYTPVDGVSYPDNNYGRQLQQVVHLIKSNLGLQIANIDLDGWDTHSNQGGASGNHASRLALFSAGLEALYMDLGSLMDNVIVLTMTEFGRTAAENGSAGTDHGNASCWFVMGRGVNGGIYGSWPGLLPNQLYKQRYLKHSIEYSDVFAEIILKHLSNSHLSYVLPGHKYKPIGFLS